MLRNRFVVATLMYLCAIAAAPAAAEDKWDLDTVLYGWFAGLDGTIGLKNLQDQPLDLSFDALAEYVDFALAGHFEARNPQLVLIADISFVGLSTSRDGTFLRQPVTANLDIDQWIVEAGGGYRVTQKFDVLLAGRYYFFDVGTNSLSILGERSKTSSLGWGDIFIGARYSQVIRQKWFVSARGDVGGGGSDIAWFGDATLGYRFTKRFSLAVAWRVLSLDYTGDESDNYLRWDVTQSGLGVGIGFRL